MSKDSKLSIVAIGASAGGLEPFESFFDSTPNNLGVAYVIIQHLSPDFRSLMDQLLARHSTMPIHRIIDGMKPEPNCIYLNGPREAITLQNGIFSVVRETQTDAVYLPINTFFKSLADDLGHQAVAVILSGTGSDGTVGCRSIKAKGGTVLVQEPGSAKFDGMPSSVIQEDLADGVATARHLPILVQRALNGEEIENPLPPMERPDPLTAIFSIMRERFSTDFSYYKSETIERRIRRRCDLKHHANLEAYVTELTVDRDEVEALYSDLLIEVTAFFRDQDAFDALERSAIYDIAEKMSPERQIRIWVPGCASGEEAYSLAILVNEFARENRVPLNLKIIATDIHHRSLDAASAGIYSPEAVSGMSEALIDRYFEKSGPYYQVRPLIRRAVVFSPQNLLRDPPFTRMDLITCRNVLIYLNDVAQSKCLSLFHFALRKDGYLFLGPSETIGHLSSEFRTIDRRWRIFQKRRDVKLLESTSLLPRPTPRFSSGSIMAQPNQSFSHTDVPLTRQAMNSALHSLLEKHAPPGFLVNSNGELVQVFGKASRFIQINEGLFSRRMVDLVHPDLRLVVATGMDRLRSGAALPFERRVRVQHQDEDVPTEILVSVDTLGEVRDVVEFGLLSMKEIKKISDDEPNPDRVFLNTDSDDHAYLQDRISELERSLKATEESLQTTIEELETSNEELQATNEELMASNEELQSTNEELHSVNEELYTVSAEHQRKIEELTEMTSDMDHLLKATAIGTIFLDDDLHVRRFTPAAGRAFNLIAQDVGRPMAHVTHRFEAPNFLQQVDDVRTTGTPAEMQVRIESEEFLLRILPYLQEMDSPGGVVITLIDITEIQAARDEIESLKDLYGQVLGDIGEFVTRWDTETGILLYCNDTFARMEGTTVDALIGVPVSSLRGEAEWSELMDQLDGMSPGELRHIRHKATMNGVERIRDLAVRAIGDGSGTVVGFQATGREATEDANYEAALNDLALQNLRVEAEPGTQFRDIIDIGDNMLGARSIGMYIRQGQSYHRMMLKGTDRFPHSIELETEIFRRSPGEVWEPRDALLTKDMDDHVWFVALHEHDTPIGFIAFCFATPPSSIKRNLMSLLGQSISVARQASLQMNENRSREVELQMIFDSIPALIWYKDAENGIIRLNKSAADSMNVTVEEAEGANTYDLFPDMAAHYHADDIRVIESGKPLLGIIERYTPKDGSHFWVRTDKTPYVDPASGERRLLVVASDVTQMQENEQRLKKLNAALSTESARNLAIYRETPAMLLAVDPKGKIIEVSERLLKRLGYDREDLVDQTLSILFARNSGSPAKAVKEMWSNGELDPKETRLKCKDGSLLDVEMRGLTGDRVQDDQRGLLVFADLSERNRALIEVERKNEELQAANEGLARFAYAASHDLQEPLRKVRQFAELLIEDYGDKVEGDGIYYLDVMSGAADRMSALVKDLLTYATASNQNIESVKTPLKEIVEQVLDDVDLQIKDKNAKVKIEKLPTIKCEPALVRQLFYNLILNSLKHSHPDRAPIVNVSSKKTNDGLTISVKDNGIGFDVDRADQLFDPFVKLKSEDRKDGTGLGLAICQAVCVRHGWSIRANGKAGEGATFDVVIPA